MNISKQKTLILSLAFIGLGGLQSSEKEQNEKERADTYISPAIRAQLDATWQQRMDAEKALLPRLERPDTFTDLYEAQLSSARIEREDAARVGPIIMNAGDGMSNVMKLKLLCGPRYFNRQNILRHMIDSGDAEPSSIQYCTTPPTEERLRNGGPDFIRNLLAKKPKNNTAGYLSSVQSLNVTREIVGWKEKTE